jgi:hypothetical protein
MQACGHAWIPWRTYKGQIAKCANTDILRKLEGVLAMLDRLIHLHRLLQVPQRGGTLVNPQFPATVNHYFPTSHVVYTCVLAALGKFNPARAVAPAGFGTGAIAIGYSKGRAGKPTVQYELR